MGFTPSTTRPLAKIQLPFEEYIGTPATILATFSYANPSTVAFARRNPFSTKKQLWFLICSAASTIALSKLGKSALGYAAVATLIMPPLLYIATAMINLKNQNTIKRCARISFFASLIFNIEIGVHALISQTTSMPMAIGWVVINSVILSLYTIKTLEKRSS